MKILLVEDDHKILEYLIKGLKEDGFSVDSANSGDDGLYLALSNTYDLIILDWMLPVFDGIFIGQKIREKNISTPIIMLTAKNDIDDKIISLNAGIDSYITKPFVFRELTAHINALLRRTNFDIQNIVHFDTLEVDVMNRTVKRSGKNIELTSKEFNILLHMIKNKNRIITHTEIQDTIWGMNEIISSNIINVFIHHLRKKIDLESEEPLIKTVRGSGYKFCSSK